MSTHIDRLDESAGAGSTLVELLRFRGSHQPDQRAFTYLADGDSETARLTYGELDDGARRIAGWLRSENLEGQRALLLFPTGLDHVTAFFGCLYAGVVAVPAYPPLHRRLASRIAPIASDAGATMALTTRSFHATVVQAFAERTDTGDVRTQSTDDIPPEYAERWHEPTVAPESLAYLQYTSGSTASPKGVMVSHDNLMHNQNLLRRAFGQSSRSTLVSWLPLYHDFGLIGNVLHAVYVGAPCILMPPLSFLQQPVRWLRAITRYRATYSGGPNFAYELCTEKIPSEAAASLSLSSWKAALNGAEPVRHDTLERFERAFAPAGFRRNAFCPGYGLAENTLIVSGNPRTAPPRHRHLRKTHLSRHRVVEARKHHEDARPVVGCGEVGTGHEVVIADPKRRVPCPPGRVGEIWIRGKSVAQGYWNRREATEATFRARLADTGEGPYLRTGDLGFVLDGELYVCGRLKDLVILTGENHYPQDIEWTVEQSHAALRASAGAAFAVEQDGAEVLVVVQEVERRQCRALDPDEVIAAIRRAVARVHGTRVATVALVKPGAVPKTKSGKVQRRACRERYLKGQLRLLESSRA